MRHRCSYTILSIVLACGSTLHEVTRAEAPVPTRSQQEGGRTRDPHSTNRAAFEVPAMWEYSAPLIAPEQRDHDPSRAQKDPTVVFHGGKWHVFMTVKLPGKSAIEYCSFENWEDANNAQRTILKVSRQRLLLRPAGLLLLPATEMVSGLPDGCAGRG